jgi:hypothetical protein
MKKFTLRFFVSVITFFLGISAVAVWMLNNQPVIQDYNSPTFYASLFENVIACGGEFPDRGNEEYAVYSAVLSAERYNSKMIVVRDETLSGELAIPENFTNLISNSEYVIDDYQRKNGTEHFIENNFNVKGKVILLTEEDNEKIFSRGGDVWKKFYKKYPDANGIITFSRVGMNVWRTEALVYVSKGCGWLCGEGGFIHLQKDNGKWVIKREINLWVS